MLQVLPVGGLGLVRTAPGRDDRAFVRNACRKPWPPRIGRLSGYRYVATPRGFRWGPSLLEVGRRVAGEQPEAGREGRQEACPEFGAQSARIWTQIGALGALVREEAGFGPPGTPQDRLPDENDRPWRQILSRSGLSATPGALVRARVRAAPLRPPRSTSSGRPVELPHRSFPTARPLRDRSEGPQQRSRRSPVERVAVASPDLQLYGSNEISEVRCVIFSSGLPFQCSVLRFVPPTRNLTCPHGSCAAPPTHVRLSRRRGRQKRLRSSADRMGGSADDPMGGSADPRCSRQLCRRPGRPRLGPEARIWSSFLSSVGPDWSRSRSAGSDTIRRVGGAGYAVAGTGHWTM